MEKFKKKLIICAALLLACIAYQFVYDQFLEYYYVRTFEYGIFAYLLIFGTRPFTYFLIGIVVVLLYQNLFAEAPQLPNKLKPICKITAGLLVVIYIMMIVLWRFDVADMVASLSVINRFVYYLSYYTFLCGFIGTLWQLGSE